MFEKNHSFINYQSFNSSIFILVLCIFISCNEQKPVNTEIVQQVTERATNPWNRQMVDSCTRLLQNGDVVVRRGHDITSTMLSMLNQREKLYSHCGIVLIEHGYPFVYHSIGGEDNPDARLRRDSVNFWFSPANNLAFGIVRLDLGKPQRDSLSQVVHGFYKARKKFDLDFDLKSEDSYYCAEMVYKALNRATADSTYIEPLTVFGVTFIGIDNLYLNKHAHMVCQIRFK